jgi:hypothetical protein
MKFPVLSKTGNFWSGTGNFYFGIEYLQRLPVDLSHTLAVNRQGVPGAPEKLERRAKVSKLAGPRPSKIPPKPAEEHRAKE